MLGDGITQGSPVSANVMGRHQPRAATTVRSQSSGRAKRAPPHGIPAATSRATSPIVNPCRTGTAPSPTNEVQRSCTVPPSIATPPSGFGRSSTTTATCDRAAAPSASAIVQT